MDIDYAPDTGENNPITVLRIPKLDLPHAFEMFGKTSLALLRSLTREFRYVTLDGKLLDRPLMRLILSEYRSNQVTPAQYCRGPNEMVWVADTYLQYIRSQRICRELTDKHQRREKTVQETADMIGFRLPSAPTNDQDN
ncbi:hypothetical protein QTP88_006068 [Uroleucon formosanum]